MKTYKVIAQVEVEITANNEAAAYEKAHREITFGTDVYFDSDGLVSIEEVTE